MAGYKISGMTVSRMVRIQIRIRTGVAGTTEKKYKVLKDVVHLRRVGKNIRGKHSLFGFVRVMMKLYICTVTSQKQGTILLPIGCTTDKIQVVFNEIRAW